MGRGGVLLQKQYVNNNNMMLCLFVNNVYMNSQVYFSIYEQYFFE